MQGIFLAHEHMTESRRLKRLISSPDFPDFRQFKLQVWRPLVRTITEGSRKCRTVLRNCQTLLFTPDKLSTGNWCMSYIMQWNEARNKQQEQFIAPVYSCFVGFFSINSHLRLTARVYSWFASFLSNNSHFRFPSVHLVKQKEMILCVRR